MAERGATYGWERWPPRKSLDFRTWLCRWCAVPLEGRKTDYCSDACRREIEMRCRVAELRLVIFQRDGGCCKRCGVNLVELAAAFQSYENIWFRKLKAPGVPDVQRNRIWAWTSHWPTPSDFQKAVGFASAGHLWEMNHILALAEGGDPVDPDNLETLCLRCHRLHTSALAGRLAKAKRRTAKFHNGVTA